MDNEIEVIVHQEMDCIPELILFQAVPCFTQLTDIDHQLHQFNEELASYLSLQNIEYIQEEDLSGVDTGELQYSFQPICFNISREQYKQVKACLLQSAIMELVVINRSFSESDQAELFDRVIERAEIEAQIVGVQKDLVVGKLKSAEEIVDEDLWCTSPPFSAEFDHFGPEKLKGEYKVLFEAHPLPQV